jgi:transcription elongation factor GreA
MSNYLTKDGLNQLNARKTEIESNLLPAIQIDITTARDQGDLKENAGFQTALKVRDELVSELAQIEDVLNSQYTIIDEKVKQSNIVALGNTVTVEYIATKTKQSFKIVGTSESNVLEGKISNLNPLAESILTKSVGETCEFKSPSGMIQVKILEIK